MANAADLIEDYRPGSFLLASAERTLLASGAGAVIRESDPDELATLVTKQLVDDGAPVAVGALPFDHNAAPYLVVPDSVRWAGPLGARPTGPTVSAGDVRVEPVPAPAAYEHGVASAVRELRAGELRKVVLARSLRLTMGDPVAVAPLVANLAADNTAGYTYAVDLPAEGAARRTLVGATPEMLVSRFGHLVVANPLAGSMPRHPDPEIDEANARTLLASAKDLDEHRVVVAAVADTLRPFCRHLLVPEAPLLIRTSAVWHLSTTITGHLIDPDISALRLASALHPTPAVCGMPPARARATIADIEPFDRGFYGGAVGWCDAEGDGQWVVAIRCAEIEEQLTGGSAMTLYAGAGIMPASDPSMELAETSAKFRTLLRGMGLTLDA